MVFLISCQKESDSNWLKVYVLISFNGLLPHYSCVVVFFFLCGGFFFLSTVCNSMWIDDNLIISLPLLNRDTRRVNSYFNLSFFSYLLSTFPSFISTLTADLILMEHMANGRSNPSESNNHIPISGVSVYQN